MEYIKKAGFFLRVLCCLAFAVGTAEAQGLSLITDEESETLIQNIARPIFNAANIAFNPNDIYIVNDDSLNAFVGDGNALFINTGTIIKSAYKDELYGVISHEAGHILGGHILRLKIQSSEMQTAALASFIMAGAAAAVSGRGDVAAAVILGSQSSILNKYAAYRVEEERSADQSAVKLLSEMQKSPQGLEDFMKLIQKQNMLSGREEIGYFRTHPMTVERLTFMENAVGKSPYRKDEADEEDFRRVQAKLIGFMYEPRRTYRRYPEGDDSVPAQYARAIAYFKELRFDEAFAALDRLLEREPDNPYFRELKAQFYLETGKIRQAKQEYLKAYELFPDSANFQQNLAQAMLEDNPSPKDLKTIVELLKKANLKRPGAYNWLMLSRAYGLQGDEAWSNYAAAEYSLRIGSEDVAKRQAELAKEKTDNASLLLKIDDLLAKLDNTKR